MIDRKTGRTLAAVGAMWALLFTAVHFYWAAGGRIGVPVKSAPNWLLRLSFVGAVLALIRSFGGLLQDGIEAVLGHRLSGVIYDGWFAIAV